MPSVLPGAMVRLKEDVPTLLLSCGNIGVVKNLWFTPVSACEIEFYLTKKRLRVRALLLLDEFEVIHPSVAREKLMRPQVNELSKGN